MLHLAETMLWSSFMLWLCKPHGPLAVVIGSWLEPFTEWLYVHSKEKGGILVCISSTLKCGISVYICNLSSCYSSPVEEFDLVSEFSAWEKGLLSAPVLTTWREGSSRGVLCTFCRIEILQVPAHTLPVSYIWHHLSKEQLKVSSRPFYIGTYLYFYSPSLIPLCGYELGSWSCRFPCKIPSLQ